MSFSKSFTLWLVHGIVSELLAV